MKGHKGHERHHEKEHEKRSGGGKIGGVAEIGGHPEKPEMTKPQSGKKRGGKVHGKHPGHRLDKRARGGRMTPKSPFSGADGPDLGYAKSELGAVSKTKGAGKDKD